MRLFICCNSINFQNNLGDEGAKLIAKAIGANYKLDKLVELYLRKIL